MKQDYSWWIELGLAALSVGLGVAGAALIQAIEEEEHVNAKGNETEDECWSTFKVNFKEGWNIGTNSTRKLNEERA